MLFTILLLIIWDLDINFEQLDNKLIKILGKGSYVQTCIWNQLVSWKEFPECLRIAKILMSFKSLFKKYFQRFYLFDFYIWTEWWHSMQFFSKINSVLRDFCPDFILWTRVSCTTNNKADYIEVGNYPVPYRKIVINKTNNYLSMVLLY